MARSSVYGKRDADRADPVMNGQSNYDVEDVSDLYEAVLVAFDHLTDIYRL